MPSGIEKAVHYIKTHWKEGKTLKEVAQMHGVDPGNLARVFKEADGITVKEFLDRKRMEYVKTVVETDHLYGYEIGAVLGFQNEFAFYRWARRAFGVPFRTLRERINYKKQ